MADRQSQGLQIALIAAVMLDIIFGVVAYLMWRQFDEQKTAAATALKDKGTADAAQRTAQDEARLFKEWMGFANTETKDAIQKAKDADMTAFEDAFPKGYPAADRVYRKVVKTLYDTVKARDATIADQQKKQTAAETELTTQLTESAAKLKAEQENTAKERAEREKQAEEFAAELKKVRDAMSQLAAEKKAEADKVAQQATQYQGMVADREARLAKEREARKELKFKMDASQKETFEVPTGKVISVNQGQGIVYINLGEADSLHTLTTFTVYDANTSDVSRGGKKATIEVTKLIGPHQAEAHIVDGKDGNPVLAGDVIYTPVWKPGQKRHFALVGLMDAYGDKKSELDLVRNLIAANGGIVDTYREMDSIGRSKNKRVGVMTPDTDFLIEGSEPDPQGGTQADFKDIRDMEVQADRDLVKKIKLKDFLTKIGWRPETTIQRFGPGARANLLPPPPGGSPPFSSGNISPLFKPRQPQGATTGTN